MFVTIVEEVGAGEVHACLLVSLCAGASPAPPSLSSLEEGSHTKCCQITESCLRNMFACVFSHIHYFFLCHIYIH